MFARFPDAPQHLCTDYHQNRCDFLADEARERAASERAYQWVSLLGFPS